MHPAEEKLNEPGGLATRLFAMRKAAGLSGKELAARLGWALPKVSKIQHGRQRPTDREVIAWAAACGHPEQTDELLRLLAKVEMVYQEWKERLKRGGQAAVQRDIDQQTRAAQRIRSVQIAVIPGVLQTADYARHMLIMFRRILGKPMDDLDEALAERLVRGDVLTEPGHEWEFVITESVLRRRVGGPAVMIGQLDRLALMSSLQNVTLAILPDDAATEVFPFFPFLMLDDSVSMDLPSGEAKFSADDTPIYEVIADAALAASLTGDAARQRIAEHAAWWQRQPA
jgi:transcriptional regulator with XRE-family HTH domain